MVQREVADRFFASPRTKAYGAVSVLVQLSARKTGFHPVPPTVFRPRPRVDSALIAFERAPTAAIADVRRVVEAAFAHRRKTLANSVSGSGVASRASVEEALASIGIPIAARAEELEPPVFVQLAELLR
jgi:16S rRNA (adenine1518-N6/adenine1519-N6)-dimethyltransferase